MKNFTRLISILTISIIISFFALSTPVPNTEDEDVFNTKFAIEYIAEIAKEPHSVFDEDAHEDVRLYLKDKLEEFLGAENVTEMDYDRSLVELYSEDSDELTYDIHNLLGVIPGKSDTAILLIGHYDSRGHIGRTGELGNSLGAADDGYAIALMLEVARLYGGKDLENTIYILMTDAEETGLYGAQMAALEGFVDNVGFVINIEARGVQGPVYMFETSTGNEKIIDFYKNAELPVSYSLATAVYTVMPNSTDFTKFLAQDKNGVNFAVLNGLYYYHTPLDNFTNINQSSIEHYGVQIMPLVEEFALNEQYSDVNYFDAEGDQVFFTFLPNVFIAYNELTGTIVHVLSLVSLLGLAVVLIKKKEVQILKIGKSKALIIGSLVVAAILGRIVGGFIAFISKVPYELTYVRTNYGDLPALLTLLFIAVGLGYLYKKYMIEYKKEVLIAGGFINILLALLTGIVLSGASFLFLVPGLSAIIVIALEAFCKTALVKKIVYGFVYAVNIILIIPIIFSLYLALTIGGLLALGAILVFYLALLIPLTFLQID
ncbi:MAG: Peptidase family M28 [Candidatus Izimaplasma bacterium HR2]|nr:MAG: Peptidase family M28 [Candidatus Izimaplasma bacterium HR2]